MIEGAAVLEPAVKGMVAVAVQLIMDHARRLVNWFTFASVLGPRGQRFVIRIADRQPLFSTEC